MTSHLHHYGSDVIKNSNNNKEPLFFFSCHLTEHSFPQFFPVDLLNKIMQ